MNVDPSTLDAKALTHADNVHRLQGGGVGGFILNIIPTTSFDALARNDVLQVPCFAYSSASASRWWVMLASRLRR